MSESELTREELKSISRRAYQLAKTVGDPGMRTALHLLAEAAANVANKLPAAPPTEASKPAPDVH